MKDGVRLAVILIAIGLLIGGCAHRADDSTQRASRAGLFAPPDKSGSQLWSENCTRCHNARPAQQYSDAQWAMIVQHMRLRADLTGQEQRAITEFLQASN